jgi:peptide deformylase
MPVLVHPDARLRQVAQPVQRFDARLQALARRMVQTLHASGGLGLAAPQVGLALRLVVLDLSATRDAPQVFVNPEILTRSHARSALDEGCLSLPGVRRRIERAAGLLVRAQDVQGRTFVFTAQGLLAACVQHELDHLDGCLLIDYPLP